MRNPETNTIIQSIYFILDFMMNVVLFFFILFGRKNIKTNGRIMAWLDLILSRGPKQWKLHKNAITVGRAWMIPIGFIFSHKKNNENTKHS